MKPDPFPSTRPSISAESRVASQLAAILAAVEQVEQTRRLEMRNLSALADFDLRAAMTIIRTIVQALMQPLPKPSFPPERDPELAEVLDSLISRLSEIDALPLSDREDARAIVEANVAPWGLALLGEIQRLERLVGLLRQPPMSPAG